MHCRRGGIEFENVTTTHRRLLTYDTVIADLVLLVVSIGTVSVAVL